MLIDILILLVVIGSAWIGFQKGLLQPLLTELFALGTLLVILHNRAGFAAAAAALFHANAVLAVFMALVVAVLMGYLGARLGGAIHKMPVVRGVDGFLGVWLQTLIGIAFCYVLISAVVVMDRAFNPVSSTVSAAQLVSIERQLGSNAFTSGVVDTHDLQPFIARAARSGSVSLGDLPGIGQVQGLNRDFLQPQVAGSHLAPFVMRVGQHIPGLGHFGPRDLPRRQ